MLAPPEILMDFGQYLYSMDNGNTSIIKFNHNSFN